MQGRPRRQDHSSWKGASLRLRVPRERKRRPPHGPKDFCLAEGSTRHHGEAEPRAQKPHRGRSTASVLERCSSRSTWKPRSRLPVRRYRQVRGEQRPAPAPQRPRHTRRIDCRERKAQARRRSAFSLPPLQQSLTLRPALRRGWRKSGHHRTGFRARRASRRPGLRTRRVPAGWRTGRVAESLPSLASHKGFTDRLLPAEMSGNRRASPPGQLAPFGLTTPTLGHLPSLSGGSRASANSPGKAWTAF